jgi:hypothetical protein
MGYNRKKRAVLVHYTETCQLSCCSRKLQLRIAKDHLTVHTDMVENISWKVNKKACGMNQNPKNRKPGRSSLVTCMFIA